MSDADRVTHVVYAAAGSPAIGAQLDASVCRMCGCETTQGQSWSAWVKDTFVDHDKLQPGAAICAACLYCVTDHSAELQAITGRDKLQRMRNYSHLVTADGRWLPRMKNQKREIAEALLAHPPPRVAVVSLSGQKHLLFRARVGWWQIEEQAMRPDPAALRTMLTHATALYTAGATKAEIESGQYAAPTLTRMGIETWAQHDPPIARRRGSLVAALAIWLAQKEETDGPEIRDRAGAGSAAVAGAGRGLQGEVSPHDLGPVRESDQKRGLHDDAELVVQPDLFAAAD